MTTIFRFISIIGLLLTLVPPFLFLFGTIGLSLNHQLLLVGMILWFIGAFKSIKK